MMTTTEDFIRQAVARLQDCETSSDVASLFEREGVRGSVGNSMTCPVSCHLILKGAYRVYTGLFRSIFSIDPDGIHVEEVFWNQGVVDFIMDFDRAHYPHLILHG